MVSQNKNELIDIFTKACEESEIMGKLNDIDFIIETFKSILGIDAKIMDNELDLHTPQNKEEKLNITVDSPEVYLTSENLIVQQESRYTPIFEDSPLTSENLHSGDVPEHAIGVINKGDFYRQKYKKKKKVKKKVK